MGQAADSTAAFLPCQACQLQPAQPEDIFCASCRRLVRERARGPFGVVTIARAGTIITIELLLAIFSSVLMAIAPVAAAAPAATLATVVQLPLLLAVFTAPVIASLSAWRVRSYIPRAGRWGWVRVAPVLIFTALMVAATIGGWRLQTAPAAIMWGGLAGITSVLGVGSSTWQERLLPWPQQRRAQWRAWAVRGWSLACLLQCLMSAAVPDRIWGIWLGLLISQVIYHTVAQLLVARFAREAALASDLQREYRFVWYNE